AVDAAVRAFQLDATLGHAEQIDVEPAVRRARLELAGDAARRHAAVGRLGHDAPFEAVDLDASVDGSELHIRPRRDLDAILDLNAAGQESEARRARDFRLDPDPPLPPVFHYPHP